MFQRFAHVAEFVAHSLVSRRNLSQGFTVEDQPIRLDPAVVGQNLVTGNANCPADERLTAVVNLKFAQHDYGDVLKQVVAFCTIAHRRANESRNDRLGLRPQPR